MADDIAELGIRFHTEGATETKRDMADVAQGADKAAKATDGLSSSAIKLNTATGIASQGLIKMAAGIGALTGGLVSLAVTAFEELTRKISEFIKSIVKAGLESEQSAAVLRVVGTNAGWTAAQIDLVKDAFERSNIVGEDANKAMTRLAAAHLSAGSAAKVAALSADLSVASNRSLAETTLLVAQAIATGNQRAFFQLGIHVDMNKAIKDEAKTLGDHVKVLTLAQASEARWAAIQQASIGYTGAHAASLATLAGKAETLTAKWDLLKDAMGQLILPAVKIAFDDVANAITKITPLIEKVSEGFSGFLGNSTVKTYIYDIKSAFDALYPVLGNIGDILKDVGSVMLDMASSPLATWTANTLTNAFISFLAILKDAKPLLNDILELFNSIASSNITQMIGTELVHAFKDLVNGIKESVYQLRTLIISFNELIGLSKIPLGPKGGPGDIVPGVNLNKGAVGKTLWDKGGLFDFTPTPPPEASRAMAAKINKAIGDIFTFLPSSPAATSNASETIANIRKRPDVAAIIAKADAAQKQNTLDYQMGNVDWSKTVSPQRGTTATRSTATNNNPGSINVPGGGSGQRQQRDRTDDEIAKAASEELKAQLALTKDIQEIAVIKHQQVATELAKQLSDVAANKNITAAGKATIIALDKKAAMEKDELIDRELIAAQNKEILDHTKEINNLLDRQAKATSTLTPFADQIAKSNQNILVLKQQQELSEKMEADRLAIEAAPNDVKLAADKLQEESQLKITQALELKAQTLTDNLAIIKQNAQYDQDYKSIQTSVLQSQQNAASTELEKYEIGKKILATEQEIARSKAQEAIDAAQAVLLAEQQAGKDTTSAQRALDLAWAQYAGLIEVQQNDVKAATGSFLDNLNSASSGFQSLSDAIKSHDWVKIFNSIQSIITSLAKAFDSFSQSVNTAGTNSGATGGSGILSKIFNVGKQVLGLGGGAATGGLGFLSGLAGAGGAAGAFSLGGGSVLAGGGLNLALGGGGLLGGLGGGGATASLAGGLGGALGGIGSAIASLAGPIGIIAGIGSLLGGLFKSKPSNFTAVSQFSGLSGPVNITGDKPNDNTLALVKQASQGILAAENSLSKFGITVDTTISAIEIGQRDLSQIHLSTGQILKTAQGDAAAAADAGLKAVLQAANYADPQMKKLVDSMIAAGKGFDDITATLSDYQAVQANINDINNQILRISDPLKAGLNDVTDAIEKQRQAYQDALTQQLITTDQFAMLNQQLSQLQDLQIGQVFAQMKTQMTQAAADLFGSAKAALQNSMDTLTANVSSAAADLKNVYDREVATRQASIATFTQLSTSLKAFLKTLDVSSAGLSPQNAYLAAKAQFEDVSKRTQTGTQEQRAQAGQEYEGIAQAFLQASQAYNGVGQGFQNDLAAVKANTQAAISRDDLTVKNMNKQIDILTQVVGQNIDLNKNTQTIADAITKFATANATATYFKSVVDPLLAINDNVLTIGDALRAFLEAQRAYNAALVEYNGQLNTALQAQHSGSTSGGPSTTGAGTGLAGNYTGYVEGNPDLKSFWKAQQGWAAGLTEAEFGLEHWTRYGIKENRAIKPYQFGGDFMVGGQGGTDSQLVKFKASPDERVSVQTPNQVDQQTKANEALTKAVEELRDRLDQLIIEAKADKNQMIGQTAQLSAKLDQVTEAVAGVKRSVRKVA